MSYTGEDGREIHFRLKIQLRPHWRDLAIALKFPLHEITALESKDDPVYYVFSKWLQGANQENDPRSVTWRTLIAALRHANIQDEATVLETHLVDTSESVAKPGKLVRSMHGFLENRFCSVAVYMLVVQGLKPLPCL